MILAPSRLRPLSGSRYPFFIFLILLFIFSACGSSKRISDRVGNSRQNTNRTNKVIVSDNKVVLDTAEWYIVDESIAPPIGKKAPTPILKKDIYNVTILIPFNAGKFQLESLMDSKSGVRFANYYAGILMGLEAFEKEGTRINVDVIDSHDKNINGILNLPSTRSADIIVGPYDRQQLKEVVKFGKDKDVVIISPWQAIRDAEDADANYIQLRPALSDYYLKMLKSAFGNFTKDQIHIVTREDNYTDSRRAASLRRIAIENNLINDMDSIHIVTLNEDSLLIGETAYDSIFQTKDNGVYIFPNWSNGDEDFIYSALRRMSVEKEAGRVHVYGMPIMLDSEKIDFEYFRNLDINVIRWKYVDGNSPLVKKFQRTFLDQFGSLPTNDALDAYDMINYVLYNVAHYGKYFQYHNSIYNRLLQTGFDIQPELNEVTEFNGSGSIKYFVNRHLDVIRFDGQYFSKTF